jgi:hypothetical protein
MTVNKEEQQNLIARVREILSTYHPLDTVRGELEALGFGVRAEHGDVVSMENASAEIFVQLFLNEQRDVFDHHVVTFEEIDLKPPKQA